MTTTDNNQTQNSVLVQPFGLYQDGEEKKRYVHVNSARTAARKMADANPGAIVEVWDEERSVRKYSAQLGVDDGSVGNSNRANNTTEEKEEETMTTATDNVTTDDERAAIAELERQSTMTPEELTNEAGDELLADEILAKAAAIVAADLVTVKETVENDKLTMQIVDATEDSLTRVSKVNSLVEWAADQKRDKGEISLGLHNAVINGYKSLDEAVAEFNELPPEDKAKAKKTASANGANKRRTNGRTKAEKAAPKPKLTWKVVTLDAEGNEDKVLYECITNPDLLALIGEKKDSGKVRLALALEHGAPCKMVNLITGKEYTAKGKRKKAKANGTEESAKATEAA